MPQLGETTGGQVLNDAGAGRPVETESVTRILETFDAVMPGTVNLYLRQQPGVFYVGPKAFADVDPDIDHSDRASVEAKIGEMVTLLSSRGELSDEAILPTASYIRCLEIGEHDQLKIRLRDTKSDKYRDGYLMRGEYAAFVRNYEPTKKPPAKIKGDSEPGKYMTVGTINGRREKVTTRRLVEVAKILQVVQFEPVGAVTAA